MPLLPSRRFDESLHNAHYDLLVRSYQARRIRRGDHLGEPLAPAAVRDTVRERAALAGLPADFGAHSLWSGFVTEAARQGVPIGETMALAGHASPASLLGYFRAAEALRGTGASLVEAAAPARKNEPPTT